MLQKIPAKARGRPDGCLGGKMLGREADYETMMEKAKKMAAGWAVRAANGDGSYRLAFDRPGTWSMKYNIVWDKLFGTGVMDKAVTATEFASYKRHINHYGMPLDNRADYTKSDWLIWTATLAERRSDFVEYVDPLWENYNCTLSRVPMTDWYFTVTSNQRGFQHRTVQGGLFLKLMPKKKDGDKNQVMGGMELTGDMMAMLGGFTILRLLNMAGGMMGIEMTKEELLAINAKLNKIKRPKGK